jgi:hypothetical protein
MTMSISVDVSDSLEEARTRLLRTARALNRAWAAALCAVVALVLAAVVLLLVATMLRPVYVVIWSVLLAATGFNVTRFWPRRVERRGVVLDQAEVAVLRAVIDPQGRVVWPDVVRLVADPELDLTDDELVLGLPLLACLDQGQLRELLLVAAAQAEVEEERGVRWAVRVAHGDVGRSLVARRGPRVTLPTARFTASLRARAAALEADLENWAGACARAAVWSSDAGAAAQASRDQVSEAWVVLTAEWLDPAFARGRRHVAPFTGLRHFCEGADASGWLDHPRPWWPTIGVLADLVARHEETVARDLDPRGDLLRPISWEEHPVEVTVPQWRALVAEVLDAARRSTREPAVTLASVLALLEAGEGPALAEATAADRGLEPGTDPAYGAWSEKFVARVLTASIGIAAIDARTFHPTWSWPEGSRLTAEDGWTLPLASIVAEVLGMVRDGGGLARAYAELREALAELLIDIEEPLWLDHETGPRPERPIGSFTARQGITPRLVIVTDRSLHLFRDPQGARLSGLLRPIDPRVAHVELRKRMLAVWQGDTTEQVLTLATDDVRQARFSRAVGGLWWRLTLTGDDARLVLRGRGDGAAEATEISEWLGDRVAVHGHHGF